MEFLAMVIGAFIGLWIYGRFTNDAAREQNRRNLEKLGRQR